jgi:hypothetical protein
MFRSPLRLVPFMLGEAFPLVSIVIVQTVGTCFVRTSAVGLRSVFIHQFGSASPGDDTMPH